MGASRTRDDHAGQGALDGGARLRHADVLDPVRLLVRSCSSYVAACLALEAAARRGMTRARGAGTRDRWPTSDWGDVFAWYYGMGV